MQQELFYLSLILCLGLLITTATYMNRFNNMKMMFESADKTNDNLLRERMELQKTVTELEYLVNKRDESIEVLKFAMDERDGKLSDQAKLIQKLTDELTIKNTTIESLTKHLQDNHKQDKTFNVLESLDDLIPRKEAGKPKKEKNKGN